MMLTCYAIVYVCYSNYRNIGICTESFEPFPIAATDWAINWPLHVCV